MGRISVVIPAYQAAQYLPRTLQAIAASTRRPEECIVVDDHSPVSPQALVAGQPIPVIFIRHESNRGPSVTRNTGAAAATGEILVFIDSDVAVHPDTIGRLERGLEEDPRLGAITGSYDDCPLHPAFLSQYRNLLHAYYHRQGKRLIRTWWAGCGAIRRPVFKRHGGFDPLSRGLEDVEFGVRMTASGVKILLDPAIQGQHQKAWPLLELIRTDMLSRAVPWTELILRTGHAPDDLNTGLSQRISLLLTAVMLLFVPVAVVHPTSAAVIPAIFLSIVLLNLAVFQFFAERRGWWFAVRTMPCFTLYLMCGGFGLVIGALRYFTARFRHGK